MPNHQSSLSQNRDFGQSPSLTPVHVYNHSQQLSSLSTQHFGSTRGNKQVKSQATVPATARSRATCKLFPGRRGRRPSRRLPAPCCLPALTHPFPWGADAASSLSSEDPGETGAGDRRRAVPGREARSPPGPGDARGAISAPVGEHSQGFQHG